MFPYAEIIEFICFLISIICLRKKQTGVWRTLIFFLLITVITEVSGRIISKSHHSNHWLYNIYLPLQTLFIGWFVYQIYFAWQVSKWWFISGYIVFLTVFIIESFQNSFSNYNATSDSVASFLFVIMACSYYYFLLKEDRYTDLLHNAVFWFITGVFLFNFGSMASTLFSNELLGLYVARKVSLRYLIYLSLIIIIYSCWSYSFKCKYQETILS